MNERQESNKQMPISVLTRLSAIGLLELFALLTIIKSCF